MTTARANEILKELKELQKSRPDELDTESNKLFEAIMKISDERDYYKHKYRILKYSTVPRLEGELKGTKEGVELWKNLFEEGGNYE